MVDGGWQGRWVLILIQHLLNRDPRDGVIEGIVLQRGGGEVGYRGNGVLGEFERYLFYGRYVVGRLHYRTL